MITITFPKHANIKYKKETMKKALRLAVGIGFYDFMIL